jgi:hypothetical protein
MNLCTWIYSLCYFRFFLKKGLTGNGKLIYIFNLLETKDTTEGDGATEIVAHLVRGAWHWNSIGVITDGDIIVSALMIFLDIFLSARF